MTKTPLVLIHGTWGSGNSWDTIRPDLEDLGFEVYAPSLRYHDLSYHEVEKHIGNVSNLDYVDDLVELIRNLPEAPIVVGHSLGCLLAQMIAERIHVKGMILLGPAPTADIFSAYPTMVAAFGRHFLRPKFWKKPMPPYPLAKKIGYNQQDQAVIEKSLKEGVPESGRVYTEMALASLFKAPVTKVDFSQIECPVLIVTGANDKMTVPQIAYKTGKNYGNQATTIYLGEADHYYIGEKFKGQTIFQIKRWLAKEDLAPQS